MDSRGRGTDKEVVRPEGAGGAGTSEGDCRRLMLVQRSGGATACRHDHTAAVTANPQLGPCRAASPDHQSFLHPNHATFPPPA